MKTPICDFIKEYSKRGGLRLHMPGHKGISEVGGFAAHSFDITEIEGADVLYQSEGIIRDSEKNAELLFDSERTIYSTEGSSLAIRAMLHLVLLYAHHQGKKPVVATGRNVHKTFLSAAALLDFDIDWLCGEGADSILSCNITPAYLKQYFNRCEMSPVAVYITSPDYLGNMVDIGEISKVCKDHGALLLVDNAHGAYLRFLPKSIHPINNGADMCCDSAHKTLNVLTGGAYLHISHNAPCQLVDWAEDSMALFASTSPSYLILQSLDMANRTMAENYKESLEHFIKSVECIKNKLVNTGYDFVGDEQLKLTLDAKKYGYSGRELSDILRRANIECEFADNDYLVLMLTPNIGEVGLEQLYTALAQIPKRQSIMKKSPLLNNLPRRVMSPRQAMMLPRERQPIDRCKGKILADASVSCPPAVPVVICGELITDDALLCMKYYGINELSVVKDI
ncbi:MAG: PLP-dependent transferase [Eubacteriales bacterium]|nr:PLP-dependent transferase [Eubacteriales bacterium]